MTTWRWSLGLAALVLVAGGTRAGEVEERVLKAVEKFGGTFTRDEKAPGKPVVEVSLRYMPKADDALMKEVASLKQLRKLNLYNTPVSNAGLRHLSVLKELRELDLSYTEVDGAGLHNLREMEHLEVLKLDGLDVLDSSVKDLLRLKVTVHARQNV